MKNLGIPKAVCLLLLLLHSFLQQLLLAGPLLLRPLGGGPLGLTHLDPPKLQVGLLLFLSRAGGLLPLAACLFRSIGLPATIKHQPNIE